MPSDQFTRRAIVGGILAASMVRRTAHAAAQTSGILPATIANAAGMVNATMQELMSQMGFLQEFGIQPTILSIADGSKITAGIIGGQVDGTMMTGFSQVFPAIERGARMKILAGAALLPTLAVFTGKPDVRALKDLEGRTVGTGSIGSLLHQLMVALLLKHKVDVSKVRFVNIGASVDVFRAVVVGTVDAGPGEIAIIDQQQEHKVRLVEGGNMAVELPEYTYQGAWTSDQVISGKRETLVRVLAAYAKLYRFVQTPEAKDAFLRARKTIYPNGTESEGLLQWKFIQDYKPFSTGLVLGEERLNYMQQLNIELKYQTRILPFDKIADMSLARDALSLLA